MTRYGQADVEVWNALSATSGGIGATVRAHQALSEAIAAAREWATS